MTKPLTRKTLTIIKCHALTLSTMEPIFLCYLIALILKRRSVSITQSGRIRNKVDCSNVLHAYTLAYFNQIVTFGSQSSTKTDLTYPLLCYTIKFNTAIFEVADPSFQNRISKYFNEFLL